MTTRIPVRLRLTLAFAAVMALVLTAAGLFVLHRSESNLDRGIDGALRSRAADIAALAQQSDTGLKEARRRNAVAGSAQLTQILDVSGRVVDATPGLPDRALVSMATLAAARRGPLMLRQVGVPGRAPVRLLVAPVHAQGQSLVVVVGQSLTERDRALSDLSGALMIGGPIALLLASLAGYLLTGAALRPVEAMRTRAAAISASDPDSRLAPAGGNDELGRLGRTLNEMLARVQASVARERTFVSDASHELRTPLAVLRTELELIARDQPTGAMLQQAARSAIDETDRVTRLADDLLTLSRADHGESRLHKARVDAVGLLKEAAERARRRIGADARIAVRDRGDALLLVDPDRVGQALDNMLDNAFRYARSAVELTALPRGGLVELHVLDDGPGFPPAFLPRAWDRFARADAGRTQDGAGLGLAIVQTVARLHGGEAHAENRPVGGADVWVTLAAVSARARPASAAPAPAA